MIHTFQLKNTRFQFHFQWAVFLFCFIFILLFCCLARWQFHRYEYKKDLLATQQQAAVAAPISFTMLDHQAPLQFKKIWVTGAYDHAHTFLITNKFYQHQNGFEVITPLKIPGEKKLLLVDRGWIKALEHQQPPTIPEAILTKPIQGYIKLLNEYQFILGKNILSTSPTPLLQKIDLVELEHLTGQSYYPFLLRLDASDPSGFIRDWIIVTITPTKHLGYVLQWLGLAIVTVIAYFCFSIRRVTST